MGQSTTETGGVRSINMRPSVLSLPNEVLQPNERRQNKVIAGMIRGNPALLRDQDASISSQEKDQYLRRVRMGTIGHSQYDSLLRDAFPSPLTRESDPHHPTEAFSNFSGEEKSHEQRRQIIALITRGSFDEEGEIVPHDLYRLTQKVPTAVDMEQLLPILIEQVRNAYGEEFVPAYLLAIDRIADVVFEPQWQYLKQIRLLEKEIPHIPEEVLIREELERERAARQELQARFDAQQDQLHGILPAYDELREQQQTTLQRLADKDLEVVRIKGEKDKAEGRIAELKDELADERRRSIGFSNDLQARTAELRRARERNANITDENERLKEAARVDTTTIRTLRETLYARTGAHHTDREYRELLTLARQLEIENDRFRERGNQTQGPVDSLLGAMGYTREKLLDLRTKPADERRAVSEAIRALSARIWHEEGRKFPNMDALKELNGLVDEIDPKHDNQRGHR